MEPNTKPIANNKAIANKVSQQLNNKPNFNLKKMIVDKFKKNNNKDLGQLANNKPPKVFFTPEIKSQVIKYFVFLASFFTILGLTLHHITGDNIISEHTYKYIILIMIIISISFGSIWILLYNSPFRGFSLGGYTTILFFMVLFSIFLVSLYYINKSLVKTLSNKNIVLYNKNYSIIPASEIPINNNNKETYLIYINFDNSNGSGLWYTSFNKIKTIIKRLDDSLIIGYKPSTNNLVIKIRIKKLDIESGELDENGNLDLNTESRLGLHNNYEYIYVPNIPYQKWLQIAVLVDNRNVDILLNNKLVVSRILDNVPILTNESISIGEEFNNPNAFLGKFEYSNTILSYLNIKSLFYRNMKTFKITQKERHEINSDANNIVYNTEDKFIGTDLKVNKFDNADSKREIETIKTISSILKKGDIIKIHLGENEYTETLLIDNVEGKIITIVESQKELFNKTKSLIDNTTSAKNILKIKK